jgi:hypothetical protein
VWIESPVGPNRNIIGLCIHIFDSEMQARFLSSRHPVIPSSRHPVIPSSRHPVIPSCRDPVIPSSRHPVIPSPRHPVIPSSRHPVIPPSRHPCMPSCRHAVMPSCRHAVMPSMDLTFITLCVALSFWQSKHIGDMVFHDSHAGCNLLARGVEGEPTRPWINQVIFF